jgi:hypothetical protein
MSVEAGRMRIRDLLDASGVLGVPDRLLPRGVRVAREKGGAVLFSEVELDRLAGERRSFREVMAGTDPNDWMVVLDAARDDWGMLFCVFLPIPLRRPEIRAPASFLESLVMAGEWRASFVEAGLFVREELHQAGSSNANLDGFLLIAGEARVLVAFWEDGVRALERIIGYRPRWGYALTPIPFWPN